MKRKEIKMKSITTKNLIIREFESTDVDKIYELSKEETLAKYLPDQVYADMNEAKETIDFLMSKYEGNNLPLVMAVCLRDTGEVIGHVGISELKQGIEIGYAIAMKEQKNGYATEAVKAYTRWVKKELELKQILGISDVRNIPSGKVLEKAGFQYMGLDCKGLFDIPGKRKIYQLL